MPLLCTNSAAPSTEAAFELSTQCANVVVVVADRLSLVPADTAPPQEAEFEAIAQLIAVKVEASIATTAPPREAAELEIIAQLEAVTVEASCAKTAPP